MKILTLLFRLLVTLFIVIWIPLWILLWPLRKYFGWWGILLVWYARGEITKRLYARYVSLWMIVGAVIYYGTTTLSLILLDRTTLGQFMSDLPAIVSYESTFITLAVTMAFLGGWILKPLYTHRYGLLYPWTIRMLEDVPKPKRAR